MIKSQVYCFFETQCTFTYLYISYLWYRSNTRFSTRWLYCV